MNADNIKRGNNIKRQMLKGILEMCILSIISKGEIYTSDIIQTLDVKDFEIKEGTIYPLLSRLKEAGLLSYSWQESKVGPPRKYYNITDEGTKFLEELRNTWKKIDLLVSKSEQLILKTKTTSK